jgi:hypothetical protein
MSSFQPDRWIVIDVDGMQKVLAAWSGGYLGSDDWRLSSGITKIEEDGDFFMIRNHSGSLYKCHKNQEGMTYLSSSIYRDIKRQCEEQNKVLTLVSLTKKDAVNEE